MYTRVNGIKKPSDSKRIENLIGISLQSKGAKVEVQTRGDQRGKVRVPWLLIHGFMGGIATLEAKIRFRGYRHI